MTVARLNTFFQLSTNSLWPLAKYCLNRAASVCSWIVHMRGTFLKGSCIRLLSKSKIFHFNGKRILSRAKDKLLYMVKRKEEDERLLIGLDFVNMGYSLICRFSDIIKIRKTPASDDFYCMYVVRGGEKERDLKINKETDGFCSCCFSVLFSLCIKKHKCPKNDNRCIYNQQIHEIYYMCNNEYHIWII